MIVYKVIWRSTYVSADEVCSDSEDYYVKLFSTRSHAKRYVKNLKDSAVKNGEDPKSFERAGFVGTCIDVYDIETLVVAADSRFYAWDTYSYDGDCRSNDMHVCVSSEACPDG